MAIGRVGENATSINRMLEGIWVKTIVLIKPILFAILADARNENAVRTPAIENI